MSNEKPCRSCGQVADHYTSIPTCCKACWKDRVAKRRALMIDEIRAYDRERGKLPHRRLARALLARRADQKLSKQEWQRRPANMARAVAKNREKRKRVPGYAAAHNAVAKAIRNGSVVRPLRCSRCGSKGRIHAHHDDHTKALEIMWLCPTCHTHRHQEIGKMKIAPHGIFPPPSTEDRHRAADAEGST